MKKKTNYQINNDQFKELLASGWEVVDVRSESERKFLKVLPEAKNIPYPKVVVQMHDLFPDKDAKLIMICNAGNRSGMAAKEYQKQGYKNVYVLTTGIEGLD